MKITLIHNPTAGSGRPSRDELEGALRAAGHEVSYRSTQADGLGVAVQEAGDAVVVAGGDGTIRKVALAVPPGVPLALLPMGTANNLATTLGLENDVDALLQRLARRNALSVDMGRCSGAWGNGAFVEAAGFGLVPELIRVIEKFSREEHDADPAGELAHARAVLVHLVSLLPAFHCEMVLDGRRTSRRLILLEVMNCARVGPMLPLAPDADPADGLLDVVWVEETERPVLLAAAAAWAAGRDAGVRCGGARVASLALSCNAGIGHLDDELWKPGRKKAAAGYEVVARCETGAFEVLV
jgi:diacylglycerol kinase (ATP)